MTQLVLDQHHLGQPAFRGEQNRSTGTLIVFTSTNSCFDHVLSSLFGRSAGSDISFNGVQISILCDRAYMIFRDVSIVGSQTAITNQYRTGDFLVQHHPHFAFKPGDHIEISDIQNIVTIHLLQFVDGLRIGGTFQQREYFSRFLFSFDVTFCTSLIVGDVGEHTLNTRERSVMSTGQNNAYPSIISLDEFRGVVKQSCIREQVVDISHTIFLLGSLISFSIVVVNSMSQNTTLFNVLIYGLSKRSQAFCVSHQIFHIIMADVGSRGVIGIKYVVFHFFFLLFGFFIFFIGIIVHSFSHDCVNCSFLFIGEGIPHLFHGLVIFILFRSRISFLFFCHFFFSFLAFGFLFFFGLFFHGFFFFLFFLIVIFCVRKEVLVV